MCRMSWLLGAMAIRDGAKTDYALIHPSTGREGGAMRSDAPRVLNEYARDAFRMRASGAGTALDAHTPGSLTANQQLQ